MCLIVHNPDGVAFPTSVLRRGIKDNPDGWGIMGAGSGRVRIEKGFGTSSFFKTLDTFRGACTIHFRWATHGKINLDNAHPFRILRGKYALMHNGVLDIPRRDLSKSDTWHFARDFVQPILANKPDWFGSEYLSAMLGALIGPLNKLVIMRNDGASMVVNEKSGRDYEGLWLSNGNSLWGEADWYETTPTASTSTFTRGMVQCTVCQCYVFPDDTVSDEYGNVSCEDCDLKAYKKESDELDLTALSDLDHDELAEYCGTYPHEVATLIKNMFESWTAEVESEG